LLLDFRQGWRVRELRIIPSGQPEGTAMAKPASSDAERSEHIPPMQRLLDNPFLLLFIGVTVPAVFYLMWGLMEITQIPIAQ
jgi:hypothetical protein